jgi:hypothetical protein
VGASKDRERRRCLRSHFTGTADRRLFRLGRAPVPFGTCRKDPHKPVPPDDPKALPPEADDGRGAQDRRLGAQAALDPVRADDDEVVAWVYLGRWARAQVHDGRLARNGDCHRPAGFSCGQKGAERGHLSGAISRGGSTPTAARSCRGSLVGSDTYVDGVGSLSPREAGSVFLSPVMSFTPRQSTR